MRTLLLCGLPLLLVASCKTSSPDESAASSARAPEPAATAMVQVAATATTAGLAELASAQAALRELTAEPEGGATPVPPSWREAAPKGAGFALSMPADYEPMPADIAKKMKLPTAGIRAQHGTDFYIATWTDMPDNGRPLDGTRVLALASAKKYNARPGKIEGDHPAVVFETSDETTGVCRVKMAVVERRIYRVSACGYAKVPEAANQFLSSFRVRK